MLRDGEGDRGRVGGERAGDGRRVEGRQARRGQGVDGGLEGAERTEEALRDVRRDHVHQRPAGQELLLERPRPQSRPRGSGARTALPRVAAKAAATRA